MFKNFTWLLAAAFVGLATTGTAAADRSLYEGKTIRIVVGASAGGGSDVYSRVIARHITRYVPGNPNIIVENMPGAGTMIAANHVYNVAKPDGLTIGNFIGTVLMGQILGRPGIQFDARRFEYVGVPSKFTFVCAFTKASGITRMERLMASASPVKVGATGPGSVLYDVPLVLKEALGLPIHVISGYKGIGDIRLAAESGELQGICGVGWQALKASWSKSLDTGDVVVVLQMSRKPAPGLPNVPLAVNYAKTEEARQLIKVAGQDSGNMVFVYVLPPVTPKEQVGVLRRAFLNTLRDPEFLADAKKANVDIDPVSGEELEELVKGIFTLNPTVVNRLKAILK